MADIVSMQNELNRINSKIESLSKYRVELEGYVDLISPLKYTKSLGENLGKGLGVCSMTGNNVLKCEGYTDAWEEDLNSVITKTNNMIGDIGDEITRLKSSGGYLYQQIQTEKNK